MNVKVSIIVPTYNRSELFPITLKSIENQRYKNWECIVVDDFSTDQTELIMESWTKRDNRFISIKNKRSKGAPGARNTGLQHASGKYIVFFDSDDIMYPDYIGSKVYFLEAHPNVDVVTSFSHLIDDHDKIIGTFCFTTEGNIFKELLQEKTYVDTNSAMLRANKAKEFGSWDEELPAYQELDYHLNLAKHLTYNFVPQFFTGYYTRKKGTISSNKKKSVLGKSKIFIKYKSDYLKFFSGDLYREKIKKIIHECLDAGLSSEDLVFFEKYEHKIFRREKIKLMVFNFLRRIKRSITNPFKKIFSRLKIIASPIFNNL